MSSKAADGPIDHVKRWRGGEVTITRISELHALILDPEWLLKLGSELVVRHQWLKPAYLTDDNQLIINIQAFIVEVDGLRILVDPCMGNDKPGEAEAFNMLETSFLADMERAGFPASSIDVVLCTHLHVDHVGWNTRLENGQWAPTFPNARYLFSKAEFASAAADQGLMAEASFNDSVKPIMEAGLVELVASDHRISPSVRLEPSIGHTPGHRCICVTAGDREIVITGDCIHQPLQASEPDVCSSFCWNEDRARETRKRQLQKWSQDGAMVFGTHFADPCALRVHQHGDVWRVSEYR